MGGARGVGWEGWGMRGGVGGWDGRGVHLCYFSFISSLAVLSSINGFINKCTDHL